MAIEDDLRRIQTRTSQVQAKRARASVERDNAVEKRDAAKAALKEEFGVSTNDEVREKLGALRDELATTLTDLDAELTAAGA